MSNVAASTPVVVGVIDDGIAFAHERFCKIGNNGLATRVEFFWHQDGVYQGAGSPVPYGRELSKPTIDAFINACTHAGAVDEDELYQRSGLIDYRLEGHKSAAWRVAHGTHVMDLACGFDPDVANDQRPIVAVQLPVQTTADTSGAGLFSYAHDAMQYIRTRADAIAQARGYAHLPVVINLSYGTIAGPHDGTSPLEDAIDTLVTDSAACGMTLRVVLPAGNSYLSRCHAQMQFRRRHARATLNWRVLPDNRMPSYLEIWLPYRATGAAGPSRLEVTITSPTGQSRTIQEGLGATQSWTSGAGVYGKMQYAFSAFPTERGMFLVTLQATTDIDPTAALAPAGIWTVRLKNLALSRNDLVHAWIQRDDSLYGFPLRGRQTYFDNKCYVRFDHAGRDNEIDDPACVIRRDGTINPIATGNYPIVIGSYLRKEMVPAKYSAAGPITPQRDAPAPNRLGPDAMTVGDDSRVHSGVLAAGSRSGSVVALEGTSVAAPQIARWIADELAAGNAGDRAAVQARAAADEAGPPPLPPPQPSPERGGAGRIKLDPLIPLQRYWDD